MSDRDPTSVRDPVESICFCRIQLLTILIALKKLIFILKTKFCRVLYYGFSKIYRFVEKFRSDFLSVVSETNIRFRLGYELAKLQKVLFWSKLNYLIPNTGKKSLHPLFCYRNICALQCHKVGTICWGALFQENQTSKRKKLFSFSSNIESEEVSSDEKEHLYVNGQVKVWKVH